MEDLNAQVLTSFNIKPSRVIKEKLYYICVTPEGARVIKKTDASVQNIEFQHDVKEGLYRSGFPYTDRFCLSGEGKPYAVHNGEAYTMTALYDYREANFVSDFKKIMPQTAAFHKCAVGLTLSSETEGICDYDICELYEKKEAELSSFKKKINLQKRLSDFDVIFLKSYAGYVADMRASREMLRDAGYSDVFLRHRERGSIVHNELKEEHMLINGDEVLITGFKNAAVDCQLHDVADLLRRYVKVSPDAVPAAAIHDALSMYIAVNPLSPEEIKVLAALLKYPLSFVKSVTQYYSKKRTWTPDAVLDRFKSIVDRKDIFSSLADKVLDFGVNGLSV